MGKGRDGRIGLQEDQACRLLGSLIGSVNAEEGCTVEYAVGFAHCAYVLEIIDAAQWKRITDWASDVVNL